MNKTLLIIQREYLARVKKKSFILMTFLVPGLILAMYGVIYLIAANSDSLNKVRQVKVIDESGVFAGKLKDHKNIHFTTAKQSLPEAKKSAKKNEDLFILFIGKDFTNKGNVQIFSEKKPNFALVNEVENQLNTIATSNNMAAAGIDVMKISTLKSNISAETKQLTDDGEKDSNLASAYGIGVASAILIYISLFIYGSQVMRGVIEEKTNRVIEVIVSSVKPFQLMLGKILGVGLVGLTQFLLWIILSTTVTNIAEKAFTKNETTTEQSSNQTQIKGGKNSTAQAQMPIGNPVMSFLKTLEGVNYVYILGCFIFYFLSGYLLYSALFAAVGSAVDSETETQQFMFPITLPLLFTYILSFAFLVNNPDSTLAFWLSIIPFTAPIAMMVRVPFGVPDWQLALSMVMMIAGFLFTTWVAARIYRVGVLMYGKKTSYKELAKWFFYKE
ncbi:ABC transporter permease [Mucilaginibacter arboris]|uniref:ABC transporter permease n=1 Tax=Mucilaginibacter arboris TaxID=2682090 RepID=A0A7K1SST8_9SPHI|nr:ABC transporter permease [Mucilaginibacter arboris]MVN20355.1 ABC transporter permease [Mucilaginibacter arboris]